MKVRREYFMPLPRIINCWDVIECQETENCKASLFPDVPCWVIDRSYNSGNAVHNVCRECKVYLLNHRDTVLTDNEFEDIIQHREIMKFVRKCPAYSNKLHNDEGLPL